MFCKKPRSNLLKVFWVDLKANLGFYLTNTASLSSEKVEAGFWKFWVMLFHGPQLLLCGPYYTVLYYHTV